MSYDKFFEDLSSAVNDVRKLVGEAVEEFFPQGDKPEPAKPLTPTEGYLPKLGDLVRVHNPRSGLVERGRVTDIYDGPSNLGVRTVSGEFVVSAWEKTELVDDIGFKPTPGYTPTLGDQVRALDKKGYVKTGYVTQSHQNYKSAKVAIGNLEHVTDQVTCPWACLELIERNEFGEEPHEEPLEPVAKGRLESELDDSLDSQIPQPKDGPVVGAYGSVQAYEDLKTYYEGRLEKAQSDAQQVSQQYEDFKKAMAHQLGFRGPTPTQRAMLLRVISISENIPTHVQSAQQALRQITDLLEET
jgi:hypothetical protein